MTTLARLIAEKREEQKQTKVIDQEPSFVQPLQKVSKMGFRLPTLLHGMFVRENKQSSFRPVNN